jgi:hypothetical protein
VGSSGAGRGRQSILGHGHRWCDAGVCDRAGLASGYRAVLPKAEEESAATVAVLGPTVDLSHPSHSLAFCLHGASQGDVDLYVMINAYWEDLRFTIQEGKGGPWQRVIDTSLDSPDDVCEPGAEVRVTSQTYVVKARSIVVLSRHREGDHNTPW